MADGFLPLAVILRREVAEGPPCTATSIAHQQGVLRRLRASGCQTRFLLIVRTEAASFHILERALAAAGADEAVCVGGESETRSSDATSVD